MNKWLPWLILIGGFLFVAMRSKSDNGLGNLGNITTGTNPFLPIPTNANFQAPLPGPTAQIPTVQQIGFQPQQQQQIFQQQQTPFQQNPNLPQLDDTFGQAAQLVNVFGNPQVLGAAGNILDFGVQNVLPGVIDVSGTLFDAVGSGLDRDWETLTS
jgi:hypothetical protein